jgi:hypothetical protein
MHHALRRITALVQYSDFKRRLIESFMPESNFKTSVKVIFETFADKRSVKGKICKWLKATA